MELRAFLVVSAATGVAIAAAVSLIAVGQPQAKELAALNGRAASVAARPPKDDAGFSSVQLLSAPPLFPVLSGPNAPADIPVSLQGIARSPGRTAALLSIGGQPSEWLALGESRDGVTLEDVASSSVKIDTPRGSRALQLAIGGAPSDGPTAGSLGGAIPGFRSPPEPAGAPVPSQ